MDEELHELLKADPFEPFRIATTGGDKYQVRNPHNIVIMRDRIFYAYPKNDKWVFIRKNQISAIESAHIRA